MYQVFIIHDGRWNLLCLQLLRADFGIICSTPIVSRRAELGSRRCHTGYGGWALYCVTRDFDLRQCSDARKVGFSIYLWGSR